MDIQSPRGALRNILGHWVGMTSGYLSCSGQLPGMLDALNVSEKVLCSD